MHARLIAPSDYRTMPWKNGQGTTHEVLIERGSDERGSDERDAGFLWRLSIAEVRASAPFSLFPGCDRTILLLSGDGMVLDSGEHGTRVLDQRFAPHAFSGDWQTEGRLLGGPCRDLNLMVDRRRARASVQRLELGPAEQSLPAAAETALLFALEGAVFVETDGPVSGHRVPPEHTLVLSAGAAREPRALRVRADGHSAAALFITLARVGR